MILAWLSRFKRYLFINCVTVDLPRNEQGFITENKLNTYYIQQGYNQALLARHAE